MNTKIFILVFLAIAIIGCKGNTKSSDEKSTHVSATDTIQLQPSMSITIGSNKIDKVDTTATKLNENADGTSKDISADWTGTHKVKLELKEFEVMDSVLYSLLDSIVKREKKCMKSNLSALHWTLFEWQENVFHLTMASDVGETEYKGYFMIDNMLFLTAEYLPKKLKQTGEFKKFTFEDKNFPYPEDYSSYFVANVSGQMKLIKSYTIPCD